MKVRALLLGLVVLPAVLPGAEMTLDAIVEAYLRANGGRESIEAIQSVRITGRIEEYTAEGVTRSELVVLKKRPDYRRILLKRGGDIIHLGYDGTAAWRAVERPGVGFRLLEMGAEEARTFARDSEFDGALLRLEEAGIKADLLGLERVGDHACHRLRLTYPDGEVAVLYVDREEFKEIQVVRPVEGEEPGIARYLDHEKRNGVWFPKQVERYKGDKLEATTTIETIDLNVGVLSSYFDAPQAVTE